MTETKNLFLGKSFWNSRELNNNMMLMVMVNCVVADDFGFGIKALKENLSLPAFGA